MRVAAIALAASAAATPAAIPMVGARHGSRARISHGQRQRRRLTPRSVAATSWLLDSLKEVHAHAGPISVSLFRSRPSPRLTRLRTTISEQFSCAASSS